MWCLMPISSAPWSERNATSAIRRSTRMRKVSTNRRKKTRDALQIIDHMIGDDCELRQLVMEAGVNAHIADLIYDARMAAGLTQAKLAKLIGAKQPVIARLEDAD